MPFDLRVVEDNPEDSHDNILIGGVPPQHSVRPGADFVFVPFLINPGNHPVVFESTPDNLQQYGLAIDPQTGTVTGKLVKNIEALTITARTTELPQKLTPHGVIGPLCASIRPGETAFGPWATDDGKYYRCLNIS